VLGQISNFPGILTNKHGIQQTSLFYYPDSWKKMRYGLISHLYSLIFILPPLNCKPPFLSHCYKIYIWQYKHEFLINWKISYLLWTTIVNNSCQQCSKTLYRFGNVASLPTVPSVAKSFGDDKWTGNAGYSLCFTHSVLLYQSLMLTST